MRDPIYLDYNASTPVLPPVREAVLRALVEGFGNPSADHVQGRRAKVFVEAARAEVAALLGADASEVIFTGGGTEANNLALRGVGAAAVVTSAVEHPATTEPAAVLARAGAAVESVRVDGRGVVDPDEVADAVDRAVARAGTRGPVIVSVMLAQNETGVLQPIAEIAAVARARGALVHTDAAQAVGKIPVDVRALGVDLLSVAGHKLYAPKGVGALWARRGVTLSPLLTGAGHERGLRPGTENVAGIAGLGAACTLAHADLAEEGARQIGLRDKLSSLLSQRGFVVHGEGANRLPNTLNGRFPGVRGSALLTGTVGVSFTTGSACHAGEERPSGVLSAMGIAREDALGAIRLTLGRLTTEDEIDEAARAILAAVESAARA